MRNLKKLMAGALALALAAGMALSVSAAEVPSVTPEDHTPTYDGSQDPVDGGYYHIIPLTEEPELTWAGVDEVSKAAIEAVAQGDSTDAFIAAIKDSGVDGAADVAAALEGKVWWTAFYHVDAHDGAPEENVTLTINVPGIGSCSDITVVHFNSKSSKWETLDYTLGEGDNIDVTFSSFSPIAFAVKPSADAKEGTSPKTGASTGWALYMLAAMAIAGCGYTLLRGKRA